MQSFFQANFRESPSLSDDPSHRYLKFIEENEVSELKKSVHNY